MNDYTAIPISLAQRADASWEMTFAAEEGDVECNITLAFDTAESAFEAFELGKPHAISITPITHQQRPSGTPPPAGLAAPAPGS